MLEKAKEKITSSALRPFEKVTISKVCPACSSVFVTKKECESCGLQFWVDLLGEPFGERSLFVMREDFLLNLPRFSSLLPKRFFNNLKVTQKYRRSLLKRFEVLLGYFFDTTEADISKRKAFLFEATELIEEFVSSGGSPSALWVMIDRGELHPFAPALYQALKKSEDQPVASRERWERVHLVDFFDNSIYQEFLLATAAVTVAAYLVFRYLYT